nr:hypothetical protein Iba_chr07aCG16080 [Ipomoea batatas]GMD15453.1 hypothetical protein Iba_chr07bCG16120 [Ipomoea batatas]GMD20973.1 hypothetical protein Iba_chr07fCG9730 [Ipomoea batatas]
MREETFGGRMLFLNIQLHVMYNGWVLKIHSSCCTPVGVPESPRVSCILLEDIWYTQQLHLNTHLTTSQKMYTGVQLIAVGLLGIATLHTDLY